MRVERDLAVGAGQATRNDPGEQWKSGEPSAEWTLPGRGVHVWLKTVIVSQTVAADWRAQRSIKIQRKLNQDEAGLIGLVSVAELPDLHT